MNSDATALARPADRSDETANINTLPPELKSLIVEKILEMDHNDLEDEDDAAYDTEEDEDGSEDGGKDAGTKSAGKGGSIDENEDGGCAEDDERAVLGYHPTREGQIGFDHYIAKRYGIPVVGAEDWLHDNYPDGDAHVGEYYDWLKVRIDGRLINMSAMGCMAAVSREWAALAFPYLWKVCSPLLVVYFHVLTVMRTQSVDFEGQDNDSVRWFIDNILPRHGQRIEGIWFRTSISENNIYDDDRSTSSDSGDEDEENGEPLQSGNPDESAEVEKRRSATARTKEKWGEYTRRGLFDEILGKLPNLVDIDMDLAAVPENPGADLIDLFPGGSDIFNAPDAPLPRQLETFALCCPGERFISSRFLSGFLRHFDNLRSLTLDGVDNDDRFHELLKRIARMDKLEELALSNALFIVDVGEDDIMSSFTNPASLRRLALEDCNQLALPDFVRFIHLFPNLALLNLDDSHNADNEEDNKKILDDGKPFSLPALRHLVVSTYHPVNFYRAFDSCRLETIELGYNPSLEYDELEAFVLAHQSTLKSVLINSVSNLSRGQCESMELLCYAKGIDCRVEEPESDSEGEEEFDEESDLEPEETSDEESSGSWEDPDGVGAPPPDFDD